MTAVRRNAAANLVGRVWTAALGILFIPLYIKFLGMEAYGLVGFLVILQSVLGIMDLGLGMTLSRELARLSALPGRRAEQRDVLRTLEGVYWLASLVVGGAVVLLAPAIAHRWVHPQNLPVESVVRSIRLMGVVLALAFPSGFYGGGLMGLQRQTLVNALQVGTGTLRSLGAILILWKISPTIEAFVAWQAIIALLQVLLAGVLLWRCLAGPSRPHFRPQIFRDIWRFAVGVSGNAIVGSGLTQLDKVLLSSLLPLAQFGYYTLAGVVASVPWNVIVPLNSALFPRFAQLYELRDEAGLANLYHRASQVLVIALAPLVLTIALFSREMVQAWTGNAATAQATYLIVTLLILGTGMNGLASMPAYLQSAAGWPQLTMYSNLIAAVFLIPGIIYATRQYGAPGAAAMWLILNSGYLVFTIPIMHRRLLKHEKWRWYFEDVARPVAGALAVAIVFRALAPASTSRFVIVPFLAAAWALQTLAATLLATRVRGELFTRVGRIRAAYSGMVYATMRGREP